MKKGQPSARAVDPCQNTAPFPPSVASHYPGSVFKIVPIFDDHLLTLVTCSDISLSMTAVAVSKLLGISQSAMTRAAYRGEAITAANNPTLIEGHNA
jgi:hypothetical protein